MSDKRQNSQVTAEVAAYLRTKEISTMTDTEVVALILDDNLTPEALTEVKERLAALGFQDGDMVIQVIKMSSVAEIAAFARSTKHTPDTVGVMNFRLEMLSANVRYSLISKESGAVLPYEV